MTIQQKKPGSRGERSFINFPRFAAGLYHRLAQTRSLQRQYQEIAQCLVDELQSGRLLDVGTGPGRLLLQIHRLNPALELYGLDVSPAMIELAKKNLAGVVTALRLENINATSYPSDFFDLVACTGSLYLWDQPEKGLEEIYRILKPGASAHLFETRRDYNRDDYRVALQSNLQREGLAMRLVGPILLTEALRMGYCPDEVAEIVGRTSFAGHCRIEPLTRAGLPAWMHIQLNKPAGSITR